MAHSASPAPPPGDWRTPLAAALIALGVYLLTIAPDLTTAHFGGDGGELITAAITRGVPHPPGYPTYLLLSKLFSYLPLGTVAFRFNLFSALCTAAAAGLVAAATHAWSHQPHPIGSLAAALSFAFAPLVWSQALIAEVYGLNLLLVAAVLWATATRRPPFWRGLLLGLALTTHLTSLLLLPLLLLLTPRRGWGLLLLGAFSGLLPYALLPLWLNPRSPVIWGDPTTLSGWWWLVSGRLYQPNLAHLDRLGEQIGTAASAFLRQYAYLGVALPVLALWRRRDRLAVGLLLTTALYALYALTYDAIDAGIFFLPGLMLLNISLTFLPRRGQPILLILPITLLALNFGRVNLREDEMLRARAQAALIAAPPAGILLTPGDETIFTLWYFQTIEGLRPDLILIDANLYAFDWYRRHLSHQHPDLTHLERDDLPALWQQAEHPTCAINLTTAPPLTCENHAQR
ncbi:MAG: DUF2723 domain-containing protein [Anaerolineales bacterium]|nr:DUF2723 domain-containing protein [Anaerolineales bacterium]MCB8951600.1 DUF2723 domain-containing protein [Ardenticatenales bacterium]